MNKNSSYNPWECHHGYSIKCMHIHDIINSQIWMTSKIQAKSVSRTSLSNWESLKCLSCNFEYENQWVMIISVLTCWFHVLDYMTKFWGVSRILKEGSNVEVQYYEFDSYARTRVTCRYTSKILKRYFLLNKIGMKFVSCRKMIIQWFNFVKRSTYRWKHGKQTLDHSMIIAVVLSEPCPVPWRGPSIAIVTWLNGLFLSPRNIRKRN